MVIYLRPAEEEKERESLNVIPVYFRVCGTLWCIIGVFLFIFNTYSCSFFHFWLISGPVCCGLVLFWLLVLLCWTPLALLTLSFKHQMFCIFSVSFQCNYQFILVLPVPVSFNSVFLMKRLKSHKMLILNISGVCLLISLVFPATVHLFLLQFKITN